MSLAAEAEGARVARLNLELLDAINLLDSWRDALDLVEEHGKEMNYVAVCRWDWEWMYEYRGVRVWSHSTTCGGTNMQTICS